MNGLNFLLCNDSPSPVFPSWLFQELSKITMPVIFNEPLSFLQRLTEYMEHTYLIHQANASSDSVERMKVDFIVTSCENGEHTQVQLACFVCHQPCALLQVVCLQSFFAALQQCADPGS